MIPNSTQIKQWAYRLGFNLVGIAPPAVIEHEQSLREYLNKGYQGHMRYLERNVEQRTDPRKLMPEAKSIICTAINYYAPLPEMVTDDVYGKVARFAWGMDYHKVVREKLKRLTAIIRREIGRPVQLRCTVDTAPLAEKAHAARAGLGWIGKNGLLINEQYGSWLVLGEIITDLELEFDEPAAQQCGDCRRCIEACPVGAMVKDRAIEARKCISYLTIEQHVEIPSEQMEKMGAWLFGCDICQEVCPFNKNPIPTKEPDFQPRPKWCRLDLREILKMDEDEFQRRFAGSSLFASGPPTPATHGGNNLPSMLNSGNKKGYHLL